MFAFLRHFTLNERPANITAWHRWFPFFSVRSIDGEWLMSDEVLRRKGTTGWEYSRYHPTEEELLDRQW